MASHSSGLTNAIALGSGEGEGARAVSGSDRFHSAEEEEWLAGPLCSKCNVTSGRFYDGDRFECNECDGGSMSLPAGGSGATTCGG